jgi:hypothetical protein
MLLKNYENVLSEREKNPKVSFRRLTVFLGAKIGRMGYWGQTPQSVTGLGGEMRRDTGWRTWRTPLPPPYKGVPFDFLIIFYFFRNSIFGIFGSHFKGIFFW